MGPNTPKLETFVLKHKTALFLVLLALATFGVYSRVGTFEFVNFDDSVYVWGNPAVKQGLSVESLKYAFDVSADNKAYWHPLTWLSHMLDYQLFGLNAGRHHLVSLTIHILNSILLFYVFHIMTGGFIQSAIIATLFALHPLSVDSVAWISERKNLLSTFFWMLTMLAYVGYSRRPGVTNYLIVLAMFTIGLLSKPLLVTLPCVFLLLDLWPLERIRVFKTIGAENRFSQVSVVRIVLEKIPFFALSFLTVFLSSYSLKAQNALWSIDQISMVRRVENALVSYIKYIYKMVWPNDLAVFYPFPQSIPLWKVLGAACLLLVITATVVRKLKSRPWLALGWFWYLGTLFPFIGLVQGGLWPEMADRWVYVPQIGIFIMIAWPVSNYLRTTGLQHKLAALTTGILLISLAAATWVQSGYWKNSETLFNHSLSVTGENYPILRNLGQAFVYKKDYDDAIRHYRRALHVNPRIAEGHVLLANALKAIKKPAEAMRHYKIAIELDPKDPQAYIQIGILLKDEGRPNDALKYLNKAIAIDPEDIAGRHNLGLCLAEIGNFEAAEKEVLKAFSLHKNKSEGLYSVGAFYGKYHKQAIAKDYLERALKEDSDHPEANYNLGIIAVDQNETEAAEQYFLMTLTTTPKHIDALNNLGLLYSKTGRPHKAIEQFEKAAKFAPQDTLVRFNLANTLYQDGQLKKAMDLFAAIIEIDPVHAGARLGLTESQRFLAAIDSEISLTESLLAFDSENPKLLKTAGDLHFTRGDLPQALAYYQKIHALIPHHPAILSNIAATYAKLGDYGKAVAYFKEVIPLVPQKPEGYYNVACMYSRLNEKDQAVKWLRQAIEKGYNNWEKLKFDEDLENVRSAPGFNDLIGGH